MEDAKSFLCFLEQLRRECPQAFSRFDAEYGSWLRRVMAKQFHGRGTHVPDDAVQDTIVAIFRKVLRNELPQFSAESEFKNYLYTVAYNRACDIVKRDKRNSHLDLSQNEENSSDTTPNQSLELLEFQEQIRTAIENLPYTSREVIVEHYFKGRSLRAIAQDLGIKETTVRSRHFRALKRLEEVLQITLLMNNDEEVENQPSSTDSSQSVLFEQRAEGKL